MIFRRGLKKCGLSARHLEYSSISSAFALFSGILVVSSSVIIRLAVVLIGSDCGNVSGGAYQILAAPDSSCIPSAHDSGQCRVSEPVPVVDRPT